MDKQAYLDSMDIPGMNEYVDGCIERIHTMQADTARWRYERRDLIANGGGKSEALALEEARLLDLVAQEFNGTRSNAEQRDARLAQLKAQDAGYKNVATAVADLKLTLEQQDIDVEYYTRKFAAGLQALKLKTAILRFMAED